MIMRYSLMSNFKKMTPLFVHFRGFMYRPTPASKRSNLKGKPSLGHCTMSKSNFRKNSMKSNWKLTRIGRISTPKRYIRRESRETKTKFFTKRKSTKFASRSGRWESKLKSTSNKSGRKAKLSSRWFCKEKKLKHPFPTTLVAKGHITPLIWSKKRNSAQRKFLKNLKKFSLWIRGLMRRKCKVYLSLSIITGQKIWDLGLPKRLLILWKGLFKIKTWLRKSRP